MGNLRKVPVRGLRVEGTSDWGRVSGISARPWDLLAGGHLGRQDLLTFQDTLLHSCKNLCTFSLTANNAPSTTRT